MMTIYKDTLMHLNETKYFGDDGYEYSSRQDANDNSLNPDSVIMIRKQNCYIYEFEELSKDNQDLASFRAAEVGCKPEELVYIVGARFKNILYFGFWTDIQEEIDDGVLTVRGIKKEEK